MDGIDLIQGRDQWKVLANMVIDLRILYNFGIFLSMCARGAAQGLSSIELVS
jgi:hypothetical protein